MAYDAHNLQQTGIFASRRMAQEVERGWQAVPQPWMRTGNAYYMTGNGDWDGSSNFWR